ncbi:MAG: AzlD domain-containing protein [Acetilactobacillus jinshanensis]
MSYVPISLFTALVVKGLFITNHYTFSLAGKAPDLIATVIVIVVAYWTRSMAISVILGLIAVWLLALVI